MTASVWKVMLSVAFCMFSLLLHGQAIRLSGKLVNAAEQPLQHVQLTLEPANRQLISDASGNFQFSNLQPGRYRLRAALEGYMLLQQELELSGDRQLRLMLHEREHQLLEVQVRNNLTAQRKQEESLNVEVVKADFIQRHLGGSLMKSLERLPGIKTIGIGSGQSKPLIRGLGFNRVVVVDKGIKHEGQQWGADHGLELDQFAAGSVELIKGAAAFVYGSDAIAGAVDVKPPAVPAAHSFGGSVELIGKSNNDQYGTSINLYGRKQQLFFDARITEQRYGDYRVPADTVFVYDYAVPLYNRQLRNTAGQERALHFSTGYLSDHFRSIFYLSNSFSKSGFFANAHGLEPRRVDEQMHDASSRDIQLPSQQVNHFKLINRSSYQLARHQLELELGYQRNFREEFSGYVNHGFMPPQYPDTLGIPSDLERGFDKQVYSANLRDNISLGKHNLSMGLNVEQQHNTIDGWGFLVPSFDQTSAGAFVYDKLKVNEQLLLHAALRFDYGKIRMFEYRDWFPSTINDGNGSPAQHVLRAANLDRSFKSLVWSLGMNYNLEQLALKANVGKSFRMPIAKELGANGVNYHYFSYERGNAGLSPEESYQIDFSAAWNSGRWSVQLSPFYNYFPNYIYLNPTAAHDRNYGAGNQIFEYAQSRVMRYGGELQLKYNFWKDLSTELLAEYLYSKQLSGAKTGYTLPFSPPASLLLNLSWNPELRSLPGSYLSVDYRLTAAQNKIVPPEKKTPGYHTLNVQAGTKLKFYGQELQLSLQAQNLLNTRYLNHTSFYRLIELPEAGRNLILSLKVPFNIKQQSNLRQGGKCNHCPIPYLINNSSNHEKTIKIKMKTKTTSNMKHNKLIAGFLLLAATFGACKKDDDVADLSAPVITALEIGPENNKIAHPGGDVHVEAQLLASANMESVTLEINPKSGTGWKLNTVYTEGFAGLKNAEFHKHVDVPADAALGSYTVVLKVRDTNGKETKVESTLELQNDPTLPSATGFEVGLNAAGNDLHAEASITAPNKLAEIIVEIHGNGWEKEFSYKDEKIVGQTTYNFHKHMDVTAAPKGHYHVHLKVVDQAGKSATFEEHFDKP